jgi:hypothetical protein
MAARSGSLAEPTVVERKPMGARKLWWCCVVSGALGCSGPASPASEGESCFRAEDCNLGLVCVERVCSSDLTPIAPEGAAAGNGEAESGSEASPVGDAGP